MGIVTVAERDRMKAAKMMLSSIMLFCLVLAALAQFAGQMEHSTAPGHYQSLSGGILRKVQLEGEGEASNSTEAGAAAAEPAKAEGEGGEKKKITTREVNRQFNKWLKSHPEEFNNFWQWVLGAAVVGSAGLGLLLFSEISAALLYRELDQIVDADLQDAPKSVQLQQRILWWGNGFQAVYRPAATLGAVLIIIVGALVAFSAQCTVVAHIAEQYDLSDTEYAGDCVLGAVSRAIVDGVGLSCFVGALIWMCTRTLPAFVLLGLSILSDITQASGNAVIVVIWGICIVACAGGFIYLKYNKSGDAEGEEEVERASLVKQQQREYV